MSTPPDPDNSTSPLKQITRAPDTAICDSDPGDDTLERFRYQLTYTAMLWLSLLEPESDNEYIYCEHHEDILVKSQTKLYCGVQIKTRDLALGAFKSGDEPIRRTITRFVRLASEFPGYFERYVIASNNGFCRDKDHKNNLQYLIDCATTYRDNPGTELPSHVKNYLKHLEIQPNQQDIVLDVLCKIVIQKDMPGLKDARNRLFEHLSDIAGMSDQPARVVYAIADDLVVHVFKAASHACESRLRDYNAIFRFPEEIATLAVVNGKRIDKLKLQQMLSRALDSSVALMADHRDKLPELPDDLPILKKSLAEADFSVRNIDLLCTLAYSTHYLLAEWSAKYADKPQQALQWYSHMRTMVRSEVSQIHTERKLAGLPLGEHLYIAVAERLKLRHQTESANLPSCSPEHFIGMAAILTEEGVISWSEEDT